jgi:hypothetical protein
MMSRTELIEPEEIGEIIRSAKALAKRYRAITGRPLGITGEVSEYEAARLLGLELATVRQVGYDVVRTNGSRQQKLQVKGRCVLTGKPGQRLGRIDLKAEWDGVLLVLLDSDFEPTAIYEAQRPEIVEALTKPGSKARNERGALSISKFKSIGRRIWPPSKKNACLCCEKGVPVSPQKTCPICSHHFQGNGWDGVDAHWRSKHEAFMPYQNFWDALCREHRGS